MSPTAPIRFAMTKVLAAAAAALLVVVSLALVGGPAGDGEELDTLLTAASEATGAVGSASVSVTGSATTTVRLENLDELLSQAPPLDELLDRFEQDLPDFPEPPALPERPDGFGAGDAPDFDLPELTLPEVDCSNLPPEECERMHEARRQAVEQMQQARDAVGQITPPVGAPDAPSFDREAMRDAMREEFARGRDEMKRQLEAAQAEYAAMLAEIPREVTCRYSFSGSGTMAIPGKAEIGGDADIECDPDTVDASGNFRVVMGNGQSFSDNGDGSFTGAPAAGDIGSLVASGHDLAGLLDAARAGAKSHGTETLDGVEVRHVSFSTEDGTSVDMWIGVDDHIVRKAVIKSAGSHSEQGVSVEWTAEQTVVITDVNVPDDVQLPSPDQIVPAPPTAQQLQGLTNPFGGSLPAPFARPGSGLS